MNTSKASKTRTRWLVWVLAGSISLLCARSQAGWAMLAPVEAAGLTAPAGAQRASDMKRVQAALESKVLKERLKGMGLSDAEIQSRLGRLSDKEIHQLATRIDGVGAGGDGGIIIGVLVAVTLVLVIIYLLKRV